MGELEDLPCESDCGTLSGESDSESENSSESDCYCFTYAEINRLLRLHGGRGLTMRSWLSLSSETETDELVLSRWVSVKLLMLGNGAIPPESAPVRREQLPARVCRDEVQIHLMLDGTWKPLMNPEETTGICVTLDRGEEASAELLANFVTTKIQRLWRKTD